MLRWVVGGLLGAAAGIAIWVLVGYFTQYEVGWIAWVVGFLVGFGVRYAAYLGDEDASLGKGVFAALTAFGAILAAKFLVFTLLFGGNDGEALRALASQIRFDDEAMIASLADDVASETLARGQAVAWPPGMSLEAASKREDYPPAIWQQAVVRWNQLGPNEQQKQKRERMLVAAQLASLSRGPDFGEFFSPWDLVWFGLAVITAYKIGVGTYGGDD